MTKRRLLHRDRLREKQWEHLILELLPYLQHTSIILLEGNLGAGKTTFTNWFAKVLGYHDTEASSPTFALAHSYPIAHKDFKQSTLFHLDLYRLESTQEALDMGIEEYLEDPGSFVVIEWPQIITPLIHDAILIEINYGEKEGERIVDIWELHSKK